MVPIRIPLDAEMREYLSRPVRGRGGFQDLLRLLQRNMVNDILIINELAVAEKIARYSGDYGEGGFEDRLKSLAQQVNDELRRIGK